MKLHFGIIVTHLALNVYFSMVSSKQCLAMFFTNFSNAFFPKRPLLIQETRKE